MRLLLVGADFELTRQHPQVVKPPATIAVVPTEEDDLDAQVTADGAGAALPWLVA